MVLEDYLEDFNGVVITVSHDRYFLDKVAEQLLILKGNGIIDTYYGNYSEYLEVERKEEQLIKEKTEIPLPKKEPKEKKVRLSYNEQREWATIDEDIEKVEVRLATIETELAETGSDFEKAAELMSEQEQLNNQLEHLIERWSYLSEIADKS